MKSPLRPPSDSERGPVRIHLQRGYDGGRGSIFRAVTTLTQRAQWGESTRGDVEAWEHCSVRDRKRTCSGWGALLADHSKSKVSDCRQRKKTVQKSRPSEGTPWISIDQRHTVSKRNQGGASNPEKMISFGVTSEKLMNVKAPFPWMSRAKVVRGGESTRGGEEGGHGGFG